MAGTLGITWCIEHGYSRVILEVDSELLVRWLRNEISPPWNMNNYIIELQDIVKVLDYFHCKHVFREANFPADTLSKYIDTIEDTQHF